MPIQKSISGSQAQVELRKKAQIHVLSCVLDPTQVWMGKTNVIKAIRKSRLSTDIF